MAKTDKYRGVANPVMAQAMRELRRSSASGTHDSRAKRERSRLASRRADIARHSY